MLGSARAATHARQLTVTSAIVAYGRVASQLLVLPAPTARTRAPGRRERLSSAPSPPRAGLGWLGPCTRGSFGARRRRRLPQYGHSVTYGLTSDPHCLHTTNRSAPEVISLHSKCLSTTCRAPLEYSTP